MTEDCRQAFEKIAKEKGLINDFEYARVQDTKLELFYEFFQAGRASIPAPEVTELREAAEALLEAVIKDCGDPEKNPGDNGTVGWNGDGSEMAVTFAMMTRLQAALREGQMHDLTEEDVALDQDLRALGVINIWHMEPNAFREFVVKRRERQGRPAPAPDNFAPSGSDPRYNKDVDWSLLANIAVGEQLVVKCNSRQVAAACTAFKRWRGMQFRIEPVEDTHFEITRIA